MPSRLLLHNLKELNYEKKKSNKNPKRKPRQFGRSKAPAQIPELSDAEIAFLELIAKVLVRISFEEFYKNR
jgi:predicted Zn-dependent protease